MTIDTRLKDMLPKINRRIHPECCPSSSIKFIPSPTQFFGKTDAD